MSSTDNNRVAQARGGVRERWGIASDPGFLTLPYVLLLHQSELDLSSEHLNVLLNVLAHWHSEGRMPYPHSSTIARRMGVSARTVQRSLSWLAKNGFLAKARKTRRSDLQRYDLSPLVEKLRPYALARIALIQEKDFAHAYDDKTLEYLSRYHERARITAAEMFKAVTNRTREEL